MLCKHRLLHAACSLPACKHNRHPPVSRVQLPQATAGAAGNQAAQVSRRVYVRDPCPLPELTCAATRACSVLGSCNPQMLSALSPFAQPAAQPASTSAVPATLDAVPPVITLLGAGSQFVTPEGATVLLQTVIVGAVFKDPGAAAVDAVEGDVSSRVVATGPVVSTSAPTVDPPYFEIRYSVADWAGNAAQPVYRRVAVVCPTGQVACTSDSGQHHCSTAGVCLPLVAGELTMLFTAEQHRGCTPTQRMHTPWKLLSCPSSRTLPPQWHGCTPGCLPPPRHPPAAAPKPNRAEVGQSCLA
jgi:hypothetical protein